MIDAGGLPKHVGKLVDKRHGPRLHSALVTDRGSRSAAKPARKAGFPPIEL